MSPKRMTTYRRADGEPIFGEYDFVLHEEFFEELDEPLEIERQTWELVDREMVTYFPSWWNEEVEDDEQPAQD